MPHPFRTLVPALTLSTLVAMPTHAAPVARKAATPKVQPSQLPSLDLERAKVHKFRPVVEGKTTLDASIFGSGVIGDADLYLRYAAFPTLDDWDARPYLTGSNERAIITGIPAGEWYVGVHAYSSFSGVSLTAAAR